MRTAKRGSAAVLIDLERGLISRDVYVSEELFQQEIEKAIKH